MNDLKFINRNGLELIFKLAQIEYFILLFYLKRQKIGHIWQFREKSIATSVFLLKFCRLKKRLKVVVGAQKPF